MAADKKKKDKDAKDGKGAAGSQGKKDKPAAGSQSKSSNTRGMVLICMRLIAVCVVYGSGWVLSRWCALDGLDDAERRQQRMGIWARLIFTMLAQSVATELFALCMLQVGRRLIGEKSATFEATSKDQAVHDWSIEWPVKEILPDDLKPYIGKAGQPFSLNHVPGKRRCKDACMRFGMMLGSVLSVWATCRWLDGTSLATMGLTFDYPFWRDAAIGLCVGVSIVTFTFAVELYLGWIRFLGFFEVFDKSENFVKCIFWDVVFHLNVAVNEELPVRGWLLYNLAESFAYQLPISSAAAFVLAMAVESLFFVVMHLQSPGGTEPLSMLNIFMGGMAGGLNVLFTGGRLGFTLGWHFGWNITMGNVLGLSTSGIPISATFVSVAPHPEKTKYHGGVFGPEGGVVSPIAYSLGIVLLALIYGLPSGVPSFVAVR